MDRSKKMGVKVDNNELEKFNILRDLEMARANLNEKINNKTESQDKETDPCLPLEEMRFIDWKSNSSEEVDFQTVSSRRSKKKKKNTQYNKKNMKENVHPPDEACTIEKGYLHLALGTTLGKGLLGQKNQ
jgi:hypothetical protein